MSEETEAKQDMQAVGKAFAAMQESYEKEIYDLRSSLQLAEWVKRDAERKLEDPEFERRRRVFDQYCFAVIADPKSRCLPNWDWERIHENVEKLISESERFASKEPTK